LVHCRIHRDVKDGLSVMQKALMRWQAGTLSGWGVLGLNIFEHWAADPGIQPLMGVPLSLRDFPGTSPLRYTAMQPAMSYSNEFVEVLKAGKIDLREQAVLLIDAFGNGFSPGIQHSGQLGFRNVARCIFENTRLESTKPIDPYDSLLCGSEWAASVLRAVTDKPVTMIHEGIDQSLFFPGPRSGVLDPECFYVFTGGKIEFRKAQDLVVSAFREFAARHDDAVLVAAWHSPWPGRSTGFKGNLAEPLRQDATGAPLIRQWVTDNGIKPHQFIELPLTANSLMPAVLREMDCALQVSRCEACTNLPAMEAMACGVPVILANNSGMRDLIGSENCIALTSQDRVRGPPDLGTQGWGESRVDEIIEALETLYADTERRRRIGARGAEWILDQRRTWRDHAAALKAHLWALL
jgi:glycosyltransferase involved in cell wall biosynthesis